VRIDRGDGASFLMACTRNERELIDRVCWRVHLTVGLRFGGNVISSPSWVSWRFHSDRTSLPRVSYQSSSGVWGVVAALKRSLGILIILAKMRGGWRFRSDFLGGVFQAERERSFTGGTYILLRNLLELLPRSFRQWREQ